jgi:hypothetical protein
LQKKVGRGDRDVNVPFPLVFEGCFGKSSVQDVVFDGENVVNYMVNVVAKQPYLGR